MYDIDAMIERIKEVKNKKGLKNEDLSRISGVPIGTLAKILGSETKDPKISSIIKISKALGVSTDFIVFGEKLEQNKASTSNDVDALIALFYKLNSNGKKEAIKRINELTQINIYTDSENATLNYAARSRETDIELVSDIDSTEEPPETI